MPNQTEWRIKGQAIRWRNLFELLEERAAQRGEAPAIEVDGERLTFREWRDRSIMVASHLANLGIGKGDRVTTVLHNSVPQLLVFFAALRLGAIFTPINVGLTGDDLAFTLLDAGGKVLVLDTETASAVAQLGSAAAAQIPTFVVGSQVCDGQRPFSELLQATTTSDFPTVEPSDPCLIVYTGGTTGRPKGVVLSHFSFLCGGVRYCEFWQPRVGDVHYTVMQLFHVGGLYGAAIAPLFSDATSVIDRRFSTSRYWERVRETNATLIDPLGTMISFLVNAPESPLDRHHKVRACWFATAHLPGSINVEFQRRFGVTFAPATYSLSESGGNYAISGRLDDPHHPPGSSGRPWGWCEVMIADENDQALPPGQIGQILLRPTHPFTFLLHYHNNQERTHEVMRNCWLHTGDLGRLDENGYLFFEGRQAHWLRRRGENISCSEVEAAIQQHPAVVEVCVVGVPAGDGEEDVKAFVIPAANAALNPAEIIEWCRGRLSPFKIPRFIEFAEDFPRSATKREIERAKLKALSNAKAWDRNCLA